MRISESSLCNECKMFIVNRDFSILQENLPFHQVINTETNHSITSSNINIPAQSFPKNDPTWKVFETKDPHFGHLIINSILPQIKQPRFV